MPHLAHTQHAGWHHQRALYGQIVAQAVPLQHKPTTSCISARASALMRHTQICLASHISRCFQPFVHTSHTDVSLQTKHSKDGADAKSPKPARRQANAAAIHAAAAAPPQALPWSPDPSQKLPPWETSKLPSPQTAAPHGPAAAATQPGPTPEEDRMSLAALAAGITPAKAPRVGCSSHQRTPG